MASPVVAGAAALVLQARPDLNPDQVKALLMGTDKPISGGDGAGEIDVERAVFTQTYQVPAVNRYLQPNNLLASLYGAGQQIQSWTRSSWGVAAGALNAPWARSSWGCATCENDGGGISSQRSTWGSSTWSSTAEDATAEAALYATDDSQDTGSLEAPIPADAEIPTDDPATDAPATDDPAPEAPATEDPAAEPTPTATATPEPVE